MIRNSQKIAGIKTFDTYSRRLFVSRFLNGPIEAMKERVHDIISNDTSRDSLRYFMDSAHDTHVINLLLWLEAKNNDFVSSPFASTIYFELHFDSVCLSSMKNSSCFTVEIYSNGQMLKLPSCLNANKARGSTSPICQFDDFVSHIKQKALKGDL